MDSLQWAHNWYYFVAFLVLVAICHILMYKSSEDQPIPPYSQIYIYILLCLIPVYFAFEPIAEYSDKWSYEYGFLVLSQGEMAEKLAVDSGFFYYVFLLARLIKNPIIFFGVTAFVYVLGYWAFIRKKVLPPYRYIIFLMVIAALGFYNYGTNTIRAGLALSVFLFAISRSHFWRGTIIFLVISVLVHKTLLLPVVIYLCTKIYNRKDHYVGVWFLFLVLSFLFGSGLAARFGDFFSFTDHRMDYYLGENELVYNTGFRMDFIFYSFLPILLSLYYKKKGYSDGFYSHLLSTYILCNAFWLLLIRIPFTDRVAYLSWCLIPFITIYPLVSHRFLNNQKLWIAMITFVFFGINFYLSVIR